MFSHSIRKALYQPSASSSTLPPTFLLPLRARLTTITTSAATTDPNPPNTSYNHHPTSQPPANSTPHPPPPHPPRHQWPPHVSQRSPLPPPTATPPNLTLLPLLAAQPPHYITAHLHSRPYLLTAGDILRLPFHMPHAPPGTVLRLTRASTLGSRDYTLRGAPYIDEKLFVCRAVVLGVEGEPMRVVVKRKQRNRKVKRKMHKMRFTVLRVMEVRVRGMEGEEEEVEAQEEEEEQGRREAL